MAECSLKEDDVGSSCIEQDEFRLQGFLYGIGRRVYHAEDAHGYLQGFHVKISRG